MREAYARLFSENRPFDVEYRMQHRDGHWMTWHDRAVATVEGKGNYTPTDWFLTSLSPGSSKSS